MRNLIYAINVSIDGCCDHTKMIPDEELFDHYIQLLRDTGLIVYGRKTYQLMVPYWPDAAKDPSSSKADREFGQTFDSIDKVVFSHSLNRAESQNTKIIRTNLRDEILKLKQEPGKDILVGGVDLPSQLTELGLVDEYQIAVHPVVVGAGKRLMEGANLPKSLNWKLVESKSFPSGSVALRYVKQ